MVHLTAAQKKFIERWGEIGTRWGINRTVGRVHALLFVSSKPYTAEEIAEALSVSRSNVSTSMQELRRWGLVEVVHGLGERRDVFVAVKNAWELGLRVLDERKRREIDPAVEILRDCIREAEKDGGDAQATARLREMLQFCELMDAWYVRIRRLSPDALRRLTRLGGKLEKLLRLSW